MVLCGQRQTEKASNVIQAETWSAKDMIATAFREGVTTELENMFSLIFNHRNESIPPVP